MGGKHVPPERHKYNYLDEASQAKVSNFHHIVVPHQHVPVSRIHFEKENRKNISDCNQ